MTSASPAPAFTANDNATSRPRATDPAQQARREASAGPVVLSSGIIEWYLVRIEELAGLAESLRGASADNLHTMRKDIRTRVANFATYPESITRQGYIDRQRPEAGEDLFLRGDMAPITDRLDRLASLAHQAGTNIMHELDGLRADTDESVRLSIVSRVRENAALLAQLAHAMRATAESRSHDPEQDRALAEGLHDLMCLRVMHALA